MAVEAIYKLALDYFGPDGLVHVRNGLQLARRQPISQQVIDAIIDAEEKEHGPLWSQQDIEAEKKDLTAWGLCQDRLHEYNFANIGRLFRKKLDSFASAIGKGEQ